MKLSDLYQVPEKEPMLELQVLMLNINDGNNEELKESCRVLREYMQYVNRVRNYVHQKKMNLNEGVELAVTECIKEGILEEFLRQNRAEVIAMSIFEFDEERELKLIREDEYRHGLEKGRIEGKVEGRQETLGKSLIALIDSLKMLSLDLEAAYNMIIEHEMYKDVTYEQVKNIFMRSE